MGRRIATLVLVGVGLAVTACEGETRAAGSCIVAFQALDDALNAGSAVEIEDFQNALGRSLYWCEDLDEWEAGASRISERPPEPNGDALIRTYSVFLDCDGERRARSPVCRDARRERVLEEGGERAKQSELSKRLVVLADYEAFPVWDDDGVSLSPERLPISDGLRDELAAWGDEYTRYNLDDLWPTPTYYDEWRQRGRDLAVRLQNELGPDYEVSYFDWGADDEEPTEERV